MWSIFRKNSNFIGKFGLFISYFIKVLIIIQKLNKLQKHYGFYLHKPIKLLIYNIFEKNIHIKHLLAFYKILHLYLN